MCVGLIARHFSPVSTVCADGLSWCKYGASLLGAVLRRLLVPLLRRHVSPPALHLHTGAARPPAVAVSASTFFGTRGTRSPSFPLGAHHSEFPTRCVKKKDSGGSLDSPPHRLRLGELVRVCVEGLRVCNGVFLKTRVTAGICLHTFGCVERLIHPFFSAAAGDRWGHTPPTHPPPPAAARRSCVCVCGFCLFDTFSPAPTARVNRLFCVNNGALLLDAVLRRRSGAFIKTPRVSPHPPSARGHCATARAPAVVVGLGLRVLLERVARIIPSFPLGNK